MPRTAVASSSPAREAVPTTLDQLLERGRKQGRLSLTELREAFVNANVSATKARGILRGLTEAGGASRKPPTTLRSLRPLSRTPPARNPSRKTTRSPRPRSTRPATSTTPPRRWATPSTPYLKSIGRRTLLTAAQEVELARRIEAGLYAEYKLDAAEESGQRLSAAAREDLEWVIEDGRRAKDHMLEANLRLVVSVAKKYTDRGMALLDVVQEGNLGLMQGRGEVRLHQGLQVLHLRDVVDPPGHPARLRRPRPGRSGSRSTSWRCSPSSPGWSVTCTSASAGNPRPRNWRSSSTRPPTRSRICSAPAASRSASTAPSARTARPASATLIEDVDSLEASEVVDRQLLAEQLKGVLNNLSPREAKIMALRFGLADGKPHTLDEIGKHLGLTRERIRQLEKESSPSSATRATPGRCSTGRAERSSRYGVTPDPHRPRAGPATTCSTGPATNVVSRPFWFSQDRYEVSSIRDSTAPAGSVTTAAQPGGQVERRNPDGPAQVGHDAAGLLAVGDREVDHPVGGISAARSRSSRPSRPPSSSTA